VEQRSDKTPMLSDLRESGSLEQDADIVMFIHRKEENKNENSPNELVELKIAKHRNGPTKDIEMIFIKEFAMFHNAKTVE